MRPKGTAQTAMSATVPARPPRAIQRLLPSQTATKTPMMMQNA